MRGRLEPKDTVERFWGLKFIGFPNLIRRNPKTQSGSLDSPGGPSSNRRYSITGVLRRRVIMNFTSKGPAEAKSTITLRRIHLIRRPYAKRRGRRETMRDCPLSKT